MLSDMLQLESEGVHHFFAQPVGIFRCTLTTDD